MTAAFGILRLSPRAFWSMTLPELEAAMRVLGRHGGGDAPARVELRRLMQLFPDTRG